MPTTANKNWLSLVFITPLLAFFAVGVLSARSAHAQTINELATYICRNEDPNVRNACINNIVQNGATQSQVNTFCGYYASQGGSFSSGLNASCLGKFASASANDNSTTGTSIPGTQTNSQSAIDVDSTCDEGDEFCNRDIEKCEETDSTGQCLSSLKIVQRLATVLNIMTIIILPIITLVIIIGGVQYSMATGDPSKANAAKGRISNAVIALISYVFLYSFLQWLIPGGVF